MGGACRMNGREEECIKDFGGISRRKETIKEDLDVDGRIILR
jgi:hypothetical protein